MPTVECGGEGLTSTKEQREETRKREREKKNKKKIEKEKQQKQHRNTREIIYRFEHWNISNRQLLL